MIGTKIIPSGMMGSIVLLCLALVSVAGGFYLPGLAPTKFCTSEYAKKYAIDCQVLNNISIYSALTYFK